MNQGDQMQSRTGSIKSLVDDTWPEPEFPQAPSRLLKGTYIMVTNPWSGLPPFMPGPGVVAPNPPSPRILPSAAAHSLRFDGSSGFWGQVNLRSIRRDSATGEMAVAFIQARVDGEYYLWQNTQSDIIEGRLEARLFGGNVINQFYILRRNRDEWHMVLRKSTILNPPVPDSLLASNAMLLKTRKSFLDFLF